MEELQTEPIWVINDGVAHGDSELDPFTSLANIPVVAAGASRRRSAVALHTCAGVLLLLHAAPTLVAGAEAHLS